MEMSDPSSDAHIWKIPYGENNVIGRQCSEEAILLVAHYLRELQAQLNNKLGRQSDSERASNAA